MSPIEIQRTVFGIPIEPWQPTNPNQVLYEQERSPFDTRSYVPRKAVVVDDETIILDYEVLITPHDLPEGQPHSFYQGRQITVAREEINEPQRPLRTDNPIVRQRVRWIPSE